MRELATRFYNLFAGLDRAYGTYKVSGKQRDDGKKTGKAATVKGEVTIGLWENHLRGEQSLGIVPINDDSQCKFGAIDIDVYDGLVYLDVIQNIKNFGLKMFPCKSKSGGLHLYLFTREPVDAALMKKKLSEIAAGLGYGTAEIFPKQTKLLTERGDVGGWINMPYFGTDSRQALDDAANNVPVEEFIDAAESSSYDRKTFYELGISGDEESIPDGPPCLQILAKQGFPKGTRNDGLFNLGVYLRKAFPDSWKDEIERANIRYLNPPLTSSEVQVIIKSVGKKSYIYTCSRPPIASHCNIGVCRARKYGVGDHKQTPPIHSLTKYDSDPPLWFLDVDGGGRLELSTEDLQNQRRFQKRCMEVLNFIPTRVKEDDWLQLLNSLLERVNIIEVPQDATPTGQLMAYVERFCTMRVQGRCLEDLVVGRPYTDFKTEWHYFRLTDLVKFLDRQNFKEFKVNKITSILKDNKAVHHFSILRGKGTNYWSLPLFNQPIGDEETETDGNPPF